MGTGAYKARGPFCPACGGRLRRRTSDPRPHGLARERLRCVGCHKEFWLDQALTEVAQEAGA